MSQLYADRVGLLVSRPMVHHTTNPSHLQMIIPGWRLLQYGACTSGKGKNCPHDNSQDHTCSPSDDPVGVSLRASDTIHTTSGLSTIVQSSVTTLRNASVFPSSECFRDCCIPRLLCELTNWPRTPIPGMKQKSPVVLITAAYHHGCT
jgi:hypothetical protein